MWNFTLSHVPMWSGTWMVLSGAKEKEFAMDSFLLKVVCGLQNLAIISINSKALE